MPQRTPTADELRLMVDAFRDATDAADADQWLDNIRDAFRPSGEEADAARRLRLRAVLERAPAALDAGGIAALAVELAAALRPPPPVRVTRTWANDDPPPMPWLIPGWLPAGRLGLFAGPGGTGKSWLTVQLSAAVASGASDWLHGGPALAGAPAAAPAHPFDLEPAPVVIATWEDDPTEIHRRIPYPLRPGLGDRLRVLDCAAHGPAWAPAADGSRHISTMAELTPLGAVIREKAADARLLVLDPLAAAFGSNENDRALVRAFCASWDAWARSTGCAVMLIVHPPKANASGDGENAGFSGSTDWRNACRSMWTLARPAPEPPAQRKKRGKSPAPPRRPVLSVRKSSYGAPPRPLELCGPHGAEHPPWEVCGAGTLAAPSGSTSTSGATATAEDPDDPGF